jgi:PhzF family phenazine biosynthesis protein
MTKLRCFHIDAFTDRPFKGNPAAVCLLDGERDVVWLQAVAAEMNLSETAFVRSTPDGFELRWFSPTMEVDFCGHATLAAAHALWFEAWAANGEVLRFCTKAGVLTASRSCGYIHLDCPAIRVEEAKPDLQLFDALGVEAEFFARSKFDELVVIQADQLVLSLAPDFDRLGKLIKDGRGVIVTSTSEDTRFDFVSRYFAPSAGINEDPVTGSAHCCLGPFWGQRLRKSELVGYQASPRGGIVRVRLDADRVTISGKVITVWHGEFVI